MSKPLTGVLLAAGMGLRLGELTKNQPKTLITVNDEPLLYHALRFLELAQVTNIIVVGGFEIEAVKIALQSFHSTVPTVIVENKNYQKGNLLSLMAALPRVFNSFLLINTDHIYSRAIATVVQNNLREITAFVDYDRQLGADDMKVKLQNGNVNEMSKKLSDFDCGYVGMTYVDQEKLPAYLGAVQTVYKNNPDASVVEQVLVELAQQNNAPRTADISGHGWLEIDTPSERDQADLAVKNNPSKYA